MKDTVASSISGSNDEDRNIKGFITFYVFIFLTFIAVGPIIVPSDRLSSSDFHASIEISSSFIALIAAIACLIYYFGLKSRYFLIIGLGFLISGSEDFIIGIFSFKRLFDSSGVDLSRFIPGTYVAGRSMLAILIITAALLEFRLKTTENVKHEALFFSVISVILGGGTTAVAFVLPLPRFIYPENFISRPADFISAILFLFAFFLIMKRYLLKKDIFSGMLLACILINIGGQVYLSFSKQLYDIFFDIAHWANILGYCMPVMGITIESFHEMRRSNREVIERKRAEEELQKRHEDLIQLNKDLAKQKGDLSLMNAILENAKKESESQNWLKTGQAELNDRMRGEQDIETLGQNIISYIAMHLDTQVGLIYLADDEDDLLKLVGSYACKNQKDLSNQCRFGEGLIGQVALEKTSILLTNVPDGYIKVNSGLGEAALNNILVSPFLFDGKVKGIIELGSFDEFTELKMEFLKQAGENIAIAVDSAQSRFRMKDLLEATQRQAEELERQTKAFKESEARLQAQQEELLQTNEELEEQTQALERQKEDIQEKNAELEKAHQVIEEKAKELEIASKYKSEFLTNISHELRTPLNSILLLSRLFSENKEGNLTDKQVEFAHTIHSSGSDLLSLINEILDISKVEAGKMELHPEDVNLCDLVRNMERNFQPIAREKGLYMNIVLEDLLPAHIRTDRQKIEQIVKNLLSNAFKFTSRGGVTLKIGRPTDLIDLSKGGLDTQKSIAFSISDTGIGIPKEEHKLIFEAFQQVNGTIIRRYGGTGLGLFISKELAKLLGGEIQLESEEGKGSTFTLYLPETSARADADIRVFSDKAHETIGGSIGLAEPAEVQDARHIEQKERKPDIISTDLDSIRDDSRKRSPGDKSILKDKKILIVDDDMRNVFALTHILEEKGIKILVGKNGREGLECLNNNPDIDLVLMDIMMPEMDGYEAMREVRKQEKFRKLPIIAVTAKAMRGDRKKCIEAGANDYLAKPVNSEKLMSMLKSWM